MNKLNDKEEKISQLSKNEDLVFKN